MHENEKPSKQNKTLNRPVRQPFTAFSKKRIDVVENSTLSENEQVTVNATVPDSETEIEQEVVEEEGDENQREVRQDEPAKLAPIQIG